ncbi:4-hydroxy-tetrahydrodipicolinate synthase [Pseudomonas sp. FW306-02-F02-AA]|uniref:Peptidase n=1 Tax=Pseudomonas fluorescens TaxID=294 RepID=A0A0N9WK44_PSEFL|nr:MULTISPECIES: PepSY domain-containing protein [Pseudomonas]ALI02063.1 peptidase [Pseudomonas fluorescens]PMZ00906.1 4-hydroxy-tetrahydrodipicolinate synthase [Pseudomonas sp. FW306-02-F02-AB]PMZ08908.1 4-hydroxy-tetrahydrodipicolinate synthase [Pseudomonas sp. FW306-02-H06C]PMZ15930.1 4-hydroxy-tetrahydrodipicolinate synthase [Pseudomonas sp. FW306-02-F02-AA]PMZ21695.1 4-hydroxy-tetrahydrodipicolinate synthase [Pseudomonas sp. FW306-02-F08-AA]
MNQPKPNFYNLAWRWHFYAGLFVAPFMVMLALTGIVYLFKPQLDPLMYGSLLNVPGGHHTVSADELLRRVKEAYPQGQIKQYLPPVNAERSAQFVVKNAGGELNVFIDPYHADILGEQDAKKNLQAIARAIHGELMIGTVGDRLVELAAGWGVVLVVSGVFLWWPRGRTGAGIVWPRFSSRGRVLWRDLHAVTGFWGAAFLLVMLLSGMTWTGFWGKQYAEVWNRFPAAMWNNVPKSDQEARSLNTATRQTVPWAMENTPMPMSGDHAEHMAHNGDSSAPAAPTISLQDVQDIAVQRQVEPGYSITFPTTASGVFTIAVFADDPRNDATLHVDQYSGEVLADVRWQHYGNVARATEMGVMLHEGKLFGPFNQIVVLLICLMILLSAVSGVVIWWKRHPQGKLGVPPLRHDLPTWKTGVVIILALAVIFPLVGASLIVVWLLDRVLLSRLNRQPESASSSS